MWALAIEAFAAAMIALFFIGPLDAGLMVAVIAAVIILVELCNALRRDRERMRRGRGAVWQRRDDAYQTSLADDFSGKWDE